MLRFIDLMATLSILDVSELHFCCTYQKSKNTGLNSIQLSNADTAMPTGYVLHPVIEEQSQRPLQMSECLLPYLRAVFWLHHHWKVE